MPWINWKPRRSLTCYPASAGNLISTLSAPDAVLTKAQVEESLKSSHSLVIEQGLAQYPDRLWNGVKDSPIIQHHILNEDLKVLTDADLGVKAPGADKKLAAKLPDTLDALSLEGAVELAIGCKDIKTLEAWLTAETNGKKRDRLVKALSDSIKIITEKAEG